jgi:Conjugative transposon protein TcpC
MRRAETRSPRAPVTITSMSLWRMRLTRELPRYVLCALSVTGLLATARFTIAPPEPRGVAGPARPPSTVNRAAEGYACLFARRYLTWNAAEPLASQRALASFAGPGIEAGLGLQVPPTGEQRVEWVEVVQQREPASGEHIYTLAVQTDTAGLLYLTVAVARRQDGRLALAGYPAFVGAPASGPAQPPTQFGEVADSELATVVERTLRNYLAASPGELAADLTAGAQVSVPGTVLTLASLQQLNWSSAGSSVMAVVKAQDGRGVQYTLAYELDVTRQQGRWEVSAVQMNPDV